MNDTTRRADLADIRALADDLDRLVATTDRNGKNLTGRIYDARVGHLRSPSMDAGASTAPQKPDSDLPPELKGRTTYSDPTGAAGLQAAIHGDRAEKDQRDFDRHIANARRELAKALDIGALYQPRKANAIEVQQPEEAGCESCARVPSPGTVGFPKREQSPWWNPVARQVTVGDKTYGLCEWCRVQVRQTGELPTVEDVTSYRDTGRARRRTA